MSEFQDNKSKFRVIKSKFRVTKSKFRLIMYMLYGELEKIIPVSPNTPNESIDSLFHMYRCSAFPR